MKLIAILRVKNALLTIDQCLSRLSDLVDEIIILDNGSTDGTLEVYKKFPKIIQLLHTEGYHGGRDVRLLLEEAKKRNPNWIMLIDSDEIFETHLTRDIIEVYMRGRYNIISFRMYNFWLSRKKFRIDRNWLFYTLRPQRQMFRNLPGIFYQDIKVHYGSIQGISGPVHISPYRIKHYGYVYREEVDRKIRMYKDIDKEKDYATIDPNMGHIMYFPFIEFRSAFFNRIWIVLQNWVAKMLDVTLQFKRKYIRGYQFFKQ
ncbi:MAG: glycosyltransferase [Patescibacteria group bacterium]